MRSPRSPRSPRGLHAVMRSPRDAGPAYSRTYSSASAADHGEVQVQLYDRKTRAYDPQIQVEEPGRNRSPSSWQEQHNEWRSQGAGRSPQRTPTMGTRVSVRLRDSLAQVGEKAKLGVQQTRQALAAQRPSPNRRRPPAPSPGSRSGGGRSAGGHSAGSSRHGDSRSNSPHPRTAPALPRSPNKAKQHHHHQQHHHHHASPPQRAQHPPRQRGPPPRTRRSDDEIRSLAQEAEVFLENYLHRMDSEQADYEYQSNDWLRAEALLAYSGTLLEDLRELMQEGIPIEALESVVDKVQRFSFAPSLEDWERQGYH